ncbi:hypothetical protein G3I55_22190 [Streptomyces sp. SID6648]|nr:hypothetical protein [Streptomyces sp. SID6648]
MGDPLVEQTAPPEPTLVDLSGYQQADILKTDRIPLRGVEDEVIWHPTPRGVTIISQTCDIVQPNKRYVQVAPLVTLPKDQVKRAAKGARPAYVAVPEAGADIFADLDHIATVSKEHVALLSPQRGVTDSDSLRIFGMRVGRRFSRFAFPDSVTPWLEPLKNTVISKAGNTQSDLGRVLEEWVVSLRLECDPSWDEQPPYQLTLLVIVKSDLLPQFDEIDLPELPAALETWLYDEERNVKQRPAAVAQRLVRAADGGDRVERYWLWEAFAESMAAECRPKSTVSDDVRVAVAEGQFSWEVATVEDVTYERILRSEEIDLDHLSPPLPR